MPEKNEEKEPLAKDLRVIEELRETFRASERRLTHEVEPAAVFSLVPVPEYEG